MTFISYAQNFEDVLLWRALGHVPHGFYVDVGAGHPDTDSVTRALYERGWSGINVEPVAEDARRLRAARQRDVTVHALVGEAAGQADFFVVDGTGLSTTDAALAAGYAAEGRTVRHQRMPVRTLAEICGAHAGEAIHVLKVDAEGSERAVLAGADFAAYRPWVVLVEATAPMSQVPSHAGWEPLLLRAAYVFVWFDGLNRFYVAAEHAAALAPSFRVPPNVFDDFIRVTDGGAHRLAEAERRAASDAARAATAEARLVQADAAAQGARIAIETAARVGELREWEIERLRHDHATYYEASEAAQTHLHATLAHYEATVAHLNHVRAQMDAEAARRDDETARLVAALARAEHEARLADAMRASTSWRATAPLRAMTGRLRPGRRVDGPPKTSAGAMVRLAAPDVPAATADTPRQQESRTESTVPIARVSPPRARTRSVHQFHSSSAAHDAITNAMFVTRTVLRRLGYHSEIFVQHVEPSLMHELLPMDALPTHADYVLIVHFSMGFDALPFVLGLPAAKILSYHNITPPDLFEGKPVLERYARLGRAQLPSLRDHVTAAIADSEYNANELRALRFDSVAACTLLFDVDRMRARAAARARDAGGPFIILFVGRVGQSKGQAELVAAYARFRHAYTEPSRLVLVGRTDGASEGVMRTIRERIAADGLERHVTITGLVPDEALHAWYAAASLYVSLSAHEGFGVPLVEAMAHGVPVLAWPSGGVAYTLDDPDALLPSREPEAVAARMAAMARMPEARRAMAERQARSLTRFRLERQVPALVQTLVSAGAAAPEAPDLRDRLAAHARLVIAGDILGRYSLAAVNRGLARALEAERPGSVRVIPVEGAPPADAALIPPAEAAFVAALAARAAFTTGPVFAVCQHYPVWVPDAGQAGDADAALALFFWEESVVPAATVAALNAHFRGVLAPSRFVAKVLLDSGVRVPVRVIGHAPDLSAFAAIRARGAARGRGGDGRPFTFLHVSSCFPRKGVDVLLDAYARAFRAGHPVRLVIKTFANPHNDVAARIERLRAADAGLPEITLIDGDLDDAGLLALYADADAMVLPSRGEGFNLPAAEAMAAGVKLIVTALGGHADFCNAGNARLVECVYAQSGSHVATAHSVWLEPSGTDLTRAMREAANSMDADGKQAAVWDTRTRQAADDIAAHTDRAAYAHRLIAACVDAFLLPEPPDLRVACVTSWDVRCGVAEYARALVGRLSVMDGVAVSVIADERTASPPAASGDAAAIPVRSAWRHGDPRGMAALLHAIAQSDPHVVLIQHQPGLFNWGTLAAVLGAPVMDGRHAVVTLHNTQDLAARAEFAQGAIQALSRAARVIVHTVADLNGLRALGIVGNVTLLPQGAPAGVRAPDARALPRGPDASAAPVIGSYGFFLPNKGAAQLIQAFAILRGTFPGATLRLVCAEYDAPESAAEIAAARQLAETLGVTDAIAWHTDFLPHERSLDLLGGCDLVVLPYQSSSEGSSAAVRTALASGAPVAVTPLPLFEETGAATILLTGTEAAVIAADIARVLEDREARAAAQGSARVWLAERDWEGIAARLHGLLLGLRASPGC